MKLLTLVKSLNELNAKFENCEIMLKNLIDCLNTDAPPLNTTLQNLHIPAEYSDTTVEIFKEID